MKGKKERRVKRGEEYVLYVGVGERMKEEEERREGVAGMDERKRVWDLFVVVDPKGRWRERE